MNPVSKKHRSETSGKIQPPQSTQDPDQRQIRFYQTYVFCFSSP